MGDKLQDGNRQFYITPSKTSFQEPKFVFAASQPLTGPESATALKVKGSTGVMLKLFCGWDDLHLSSNVSSQNILSYSAKGYGKSIIYMFKKTLKELLNPSTEAVCR